MSAEPETTSMDMPKLLTQEEVIGILRLDEIGLKYPKETLRYLRRTGQIGYVKVAGKVLIPQSEVRKYVKRHSSPADYCSD